jgi:hypothetical protein
MMKIQSHTGKPARPAINTDRVTEEVGTTEMMDIEDFALVDGVGDVIVHVLRALCAAVSLGLHPWRCVLQSRHAACCAVKCLVGRSVCAGQRASPLALPDSMMHMHSVYAFEYHTDQRASSA